MATRDDIVRELLGGTTPYQLSKKYPRASVYRIYNELLQSGQLPEPGVTVVESELEPESRYPFTPAPAPSTPSVAVADERKEIGAETVDLGPKSLPEDAVNRIRGILGITARPKVLSMPMPELLYPAMVIAVTELGFQPMRPDDFIDTVLYQWLEACDYIPFAYMKKSEIEGYARRYGIIETVKEESIVGQPTEGKVEEVVEEVSVEAVGESTEETIEETDEEEVDTNEETNAVVEEVEEPHKPTVGDLLKRLHINNIKKEVDNDSAGRTEPISP